MKKINYCLVGLILILLTFLFLCFNSYTLTAMNGSKEISYEYTGYDAFLCFNSKYASVQFGGISFIILLFIILLFFVIVVIKRRYNSSLLNINLYLITIEIALLLIGLIDGFDNIHPETAILKQAYIQSGWNVEYYMSFGSVFALIFLILSFVSIVLNKYYLNQDTSKKKR